KAGVLNTAAQEKTMASQRPCIIVPGIQGTALQNVYPISPLTTWSTLTIIGEKFTPPDFKTLALDEKADADLNEYVVSRPSQLLKVAYAPLAQALQGRLEAPAYVFPYDWRYSIVESAQELVQFIKRLRRKEMPSLKDSKKWDGRF